MKTYNTTETMLQECEIEFQIGVNNTGITKIIEEKDLYNTEEEFIKSLKDDDTIKGYVCYGKHEFKGVMYNVYQVFFNDCEECDPVFIGLRGMLEILEFNYKSPRIMNIKNIHYIPCDRSEFIIYPRHLVLEMMRGLKNYRRFVGLRNKEYNGARYRVYTVSFTDGTKTYFGYEITNH